MSRSTMKGAILCDCDPKYTEYRGHPDGYNVAVGCWNCEAVNKSAEAVAALKFYPVVAPTPTDDASDEPDFEQLAQNFAKEIELDAGDVCGRCGIVNCSGQACE